MELNFKVRKIQRFYDSMIQIVKDKELSLEWDTILIRTWQCKNNLADQTKSFKEAIVNFVSAFVFY